MNNLTIGIKLLGLYFLVLGIEGVIKFSFTFYRMKMMVADAQWDQFYPIFTDFGFTLAMGGIFLFKTEWIEKLILREKVSEAYD